MRFPDAQLFTRAIEKLIGRRDFIHESHLQSLLSGIKFAFQNHLSSLFCADQASQSRAPAPGGKKSEARFGQTDPCCRSIRCDAIIAGDRNFVTAAGGRAVDGGNRRDFKIGQAIENLLPGLNKFAHLVGFGCV